MSTATVSLKCKCGCDYFLRTIVVSGVWVEHLNADGTVDHTHTDGLKYSKPKTIQCSACGARRPNPGDIV